MPAYLIGQMTVKDRELWQKYVSGVQSSLLSFDAKLIFRGHKNQQITEGIAYDSAVVIEFPSHEVLQQWYLSEEYQSLLAIRDKAADIVITTYTV